MTSAMQKTAMGAIKKTFSGSKTAPNLTLQSNVTKNDRALMSGGVQKLANGMTYTVRSTYDGEENTGSTKTCTRVVVSNTRAPRASDTRLITGQLAFVIDDVNEDHSNGEGGCDKTTVLSLQSVNLIFQEGSENNTIELGLKKVPERPDPNSPIGQVKLNDVDHYATGNVFSPRGPGFATNRIRYLGIIEDDSNSPSVRKKSAASREVGDVSVTIRGKYANAVNLFRAPNGSYRVYVMGLRVQPGMTFKKDLTTQPLGPYQIRPCSYADNSSPVVTHDRHDASVGGLLSTKDNNPEKDTPMVLCNCVELLDLFHAEGANPNPWEPPLIYNSKTVTRVRTRNGNRSEIDVVTLPKLEMSNVLMTANVIENDIFRMADSTSVTPSHYAGATSSTRVWTSMKNGALSTRDILL